jgi:hypothetical protein
MAKKDCKAHEKSKAWGDAKPCEKPARAHGLCNGHLAQLNRRGDNEAALTPLLGKHGKKPVKDVVLRARVSEDVGKKVKALGLLANAERRGAVHRGTKTLAEAFHSGALVWAPGKDPAQRTGG